ncbi:hypothetical protein AURDEDRAFT_129071 [Auricularia subglabra TFB-10046 SS5]|uniref:Uncharacterized protein n=1 Tax=Auricularia subglabra (strain TFB-10046 / SS5) TaxID=717982 RepID=J0D109_AURST|nr:hypothetical protein AURDEDRAFT_129071 [Auricularia subglabra TFB-10046 SS5]
MAKKRKGARKAAREETPPPADEAQNLGTYNGETSDSEGEDDGAVRHGDASSPAAPTAGDIGLGSSPSSLSDEDGTDAASRAEVDGDDADVTPTEPSAINDTAAASSPPAGEEGAAVADGAREGSSAADRSDGGSNPRSQSVAATPQHDDTVLPDTDATPRASQLATGQANNDEHEHTTDAYTGDDNENDDTDDNVSIAGDDEPPLAADLERVGRAVRKFNRGLANTLLSGSLLRAGMSCAEHDRITRKYEEAVAIVKANDVPDSEAKRTTLHGLGPPPTQRRVASSSTPLVEAHPTKSRALSTGHPANMHVAIAPSPLAPTDEQPVHPVAAATATATVKPTTNPKSVAPAAATAAVKTTTNPKSVAPADATAAVKIATNPKSVALAVSDQEGQGVSVPSMANTAALKSKRTKASDASATDSADIFQDIQLSLEPIVPEQPWRSQETLLSSSPVLSRVPTGASSAPHSPVDEPGVPGFSLPAPAATADPRPSTTPASGTTTAPATTAAPAPGSAPGFLRMIQPFNAEACTALIDEYESDNEEEQAERETTASTFPPSVPMLSPQEVTDASMTAAYSTYFARDYIPHKLCVTPDTALARFQGHVQNNMLNTHADLTAIAAGQPPAGTRVSMLSVIPPGPPSASSHFIPQRLTDGTAQQPVGLGAHVTTLAPAPSQAGTCAALRASKKKKANAAAALIDGDVLEEQSAPVPSGDPRGKLARVPIVPGKVTIFTRVHNSQKMMSIVLDYDQRIPPTIDYALHFTAEEKQLAINKLIDLMSFHASSTPATADTPATAGTPASRPSATPAGDVGDTDDGSRLADVVPVTRPPAPAIPAKRLCVTHPMPTAEEVQEKRRKADEAFERRRRLKFVEIDDDIAEPAADMLHSGPDVVDEDGATADDDATTEERAEDAQGTEAAPAVDNVQTIAPVRTRKPAAEPTRASPRKRGRAAPAATTSAAASAAAIDDDDDDDAASETDQLIHHRAKRRKLAASAEQEQDELAEDADDNADSLPQPAAKTRSRKPKEAAVPAPAKKAAAPSKTKAAAKVQASATEGATAGDGAAAEGSGSSKSSRTKRKGAASKAVAAKEPAEAAAAKEPAATGSAKVADQPAAATVTAKAQAKGKAPAKTPATATTAKGTPSTAQGAQGAQPKPTANVAEASKKRKRDENESPADEPPAKSARADDNEAATEPEWQHRELDDAKGHPWNQAGFKNMQPIMLSKADVARLTANPAKLTPATGAIVKRATFWPRGFQILLGIDDKENIMWTVLSRAFEGTAELSAEETDLVRHAYSVWPKNVNMSNEMRKMFLNVLLG